ncbi:hypothetical protein NNJEOMEG_01076 [Fundidesulfovibrio magnetotacticus]|uniref:Uncharacterized protein n=1 Tax=Fundidesulfovibrio magnetotacticus TaxID=2730080 RepID=A0A6V8LY99_9BACT|nr:hypothetical protein [Fundidesulfovibrio magnetotacticus]GFK93245.1 hypothetical protein NNJEOMEG_01076 [Fundidesulfovibrio magnetotacticus]
MRSAKHSKNYSADELRVLRAGSRTDLARLDALSDEDLERLAVDDADERGLRPDWTRAELVLPRVE